jgi:hypothetical protein
VVPAAYVFAERKGKRAWATARSRCGIPKLYSWFPIAAASYSMAFIAATIGLAVSRERRAATKASGLPCSRSPASSRTTRPRWRARTESTIVAARASPRVLSGVPA